MPNHATVVALAIVAFFVVIFLLAIAAIVAVFMRLFTDHVHAARYRELVRQASQMPAAAPTSPSGAAWRITYRVGRKTAFEDVDGRTEGDAIAAWVKRAPKHDSIVSVTRN